MTTDDGGEIVEVVAAERQRRFVRRVAVGIGAVVALVLVAVVLLPFLQSARVEGNESAAIGSVRAVLSAQFTFSSVCGRNFYARTLSMLGRPGADGSTFVSPDLGMSDTAEIAGYRIWIEAEKAAEAPATCNGEPAGAAAKTFVVRAEPLREGEGRSFAARDDGRLFQGGTRIQFVDGKPAGDAVPVK
jgi:hypothetical protein